MACEARVEIPGTFLSSSLVDVAGIAAAEARKSLKNAEDLLASFESAAEKAGLLYEKILERCVTYKVSDTFVVRTPSRSDDRLGARILRSMVCGSCDIWIEKAHTRALAHRTESLRIHKSAF